MAAEASEAAAKRAEQETEAARAAAELLAKAEAEAAHRAALAAAEAEAEAEAEVEAAREAAARRTQAVTRRAELGLEARATEAAAAQSAAAKAKAAHERTLRSAQVKPNAAATAATGLTTSFSRPNISLSASRATTPLPVTPGLPRRILTGSAFLVGDNHGAADGASDEPASPPDDPTELALDSAIKNQMAEVEAAIMLQAHARGLQGRDQLQQRRHETSASVVQRHYRGHHGRQLARAHLARVEAETRERESRSHEQAAMRVQAAHRGRHVRQCVTGTRGRQATIESRLCEGAANLPEEHAALCPTGEDATSLSPQELEHGRAAARIAAGSRGLRDRRRLRHYRSTCPPPGQLRGDVMGSNAAAAAAASAAHERQERQALSRVACSKDGTQAEEKFPQRRGDEGRLTVARERGHGSTTRAVRSTLPSVALTSSSSEPVFSSGRLRPPAAAAKRATNAARQPSLPTVPPPRPAVPPPIQPDGLLRLALAEQVAIDGDLLASWDEDGDGSVSCADFHRSLPPLLAQWGLPRLAAMGEVIDGVFEGLGGGRVGAMPVEELRARLLSEVSDERKQKLLAEAAAASKRRARAKASLVEERQHAEGKQRAKAARAQKADAARTKRQRQATIVEEVTRPTATTRATRNLQDRPVREIEHKQPATVEPGKAQRGALEPTHTKAAANAAVEEAAGVALTSSSSEPVFSSGRLRPPAAAAKRATNAARQPSLPTVPPPRPAVPPPTQPDGLLRLALAEQVAIDGDLLASWDEDGDGSVSCADFHRSLPPLLAQWGLPRLAAMGEVIDGVFEGLGGGRVGAVPVEELRARLQDLRKDAHKHGAVVMGSSKPSLPCLGAHRGPTAQQRVTLYAKPAYNSTPEGSTTELQMHRAERDRRPPHRRPAPTGGGVADRRGLDRRVDPLSRFFD